MIEGFEDETQPLTADEDTAAVLLGRYFHKYYVGENNAVTSHRIISGFKEIHNIKLSGARVRKIINHLRRNHIPMLVASSKGYYIENDREKVKVYIESLKGRINAINAVISAIESNIYSVQPQIVIDLIENNSNSPC